MGHVEPIDRPSRFWEGVAAQHTRDLETHGLEHFKRRQALQYFTWAWGLRNALLGEQLRFLLTHTSPSSWARAALERVDLSDASWAGCDWARTQRRLYAFSVRLLWTYAERHDAAGVLRLPEPALGSPFPVEWRGRLISQDLANSALEVTAIQAALDGRAPRSILELGAGYGRTAYALLSVYPEATYTVVDIEPALAISRSYLSRLFPFDRLRFLTPTQAQELEPASADLALSISTLQEMTPAQVRRYFGLFDQVAEGGVVFLKQWREWHNPVDRVTMRFAEYPVPARWRLRCRHRTPVQTRFVQAAWEVRRRAPASR